MVHFVGGIMAEDESLGFVLVGGLDVVAIDLTTGNIAWKQDGVGRPVAATYKHLVVLDVSGHSPGLTVFDAATGEIQAVMADLELPDWAREVLNSCEAAEFSACESEVGLKIGWRIQYRYRGGAAPRVSEVSAHNKAVAFGAVELNLRTGITRSIPGATMPLEAEPVASPSYGGPRLLGEIARSHTDQRQYVLCALTGPDGMQVVKLEAQDTNGSNKLWETDLTVRPPSHPTPLRK